MESLDLNPVALGETVPAPVPSEPEPVTMDRVVLVADVPLPIDVELDRKVLSVRAILALQVGSVLKMSRSAGENIDVRVGGVLTGFGEIVILEDNIGVRITDFCGEV